MSQLNILSLPTLLSGTGTYLRLNNLNTNENRNERDEADD